MRTRAAVAWAALGVGLVLAVVARVTKAGQGLEILAGLLLVVALASWISMLAIWTRWLAPLAPLEGLFLRPRQTERWCARCGQPTARKRPCKSCGHTPASLRG